jgi:nucleoside transporter
MSNRVKLSVMMFLQFFIWGAWYPMIFPYLPTLGFDKLQIPVILGAFNLSALAAIVFSGQLADRWFAAERFLSFSMLVGGLAMIGLAFVTDFWPFFALMLMHSLFYVPTISITNSIAFANLRDPQREFGPVRLWGTIGWIAAAWPFVFLFADWSRIPAFGTLTFFDWLGAVLGTPKEGTAFNQAIPYTFIAAGAASLLLSVFSLVLPHTPPQPSEKPAWLEAVKLLRVPFVLVLFIVTFLDAAIHQGYFYWTGVYLKDGVGIPGNWVMPVMSVGQIAEIGTMAFLGYFLKRLGWRYTMVIGILGHAVRFLVFAYFPYPPVAILINLLHGICYAFFFATLYIFVDEFFPKDARSSAQGLFNALILGLGPFLSNFLWAQLGETFSTGPNQVDFQKLFLVPSGIALASAIALLLFFHPPEKAPVTEVAAESEPVTQPV